MMTLSKRPGRFDSLFQIYGDHHGVDWQLLKAQAMAESALDPRAVSRVGASGLAQFMRATWADVAGDSFDVFNPEHAICAQGKYLKQLMDMFPGNLQAALGAYNWGPGHVRLALREHGDDWLSHAPDETRAYVTRILELRKVMGA